MLTQFLIHTQLPTIGPTQPVCTLQLPVLTEEQDLLSAVLAGNQRAYAILLGRFQKMVLSITLDITGTREDAEEAMQDTFIRAFRYLPKFRRESSFKTWLAHIARNTSLTRLRRKNRLTLALDAPESPVHQLTDQSDSALQQLLRHECADDLNSAIQQLSPPDELAIRLFYWHERSLEEICTITGWTLANAKSRVHRARQRLRKVLEERLENELI